MKRRVLAAVTSLWLIVPVAAGLRLAYAWRQERTTPGPTLLLHFRQETGNIAYSLATGKGFSSPFGRASGPTAWLAPVYPLLLAGIFRIFGVETVRSFFAAVGMNIGFSAAACVPIFYAGKRVSGAGAGGAAAWFWALLPNAVIFPFTWIWDTSLSALLAAALVWATLELAESQRVRDWCSYGVLWGCALLTNPALGAALPLLLGWLAYCAAARASENEVRGEGAGLRAAWKGPALAAGCAVLCCVPWTIRNYEAFHRFVPLRSNLGVELYLENNENYGDHPPVWPNNITRDREMFRYFRMGEAPFMQEEMHKALQFIFGHPRIELGLVRDRMVAFWMGTLAPLQDFRAADPFLRIVFVCSFVLVFGTLAGIAVLFLTGIEFTLPLASFPAAYPLVYYMTHADLRYRHAIDPILVLLTAIAAAAAVRMFRLVGRARAT